MKKKKIDKEDSDNKEEKEKKQKRRLSKKTIVLVCILSAILLIIIVIVTINLVRESKTRIRHDTITNLNNVMSENEGYALIDVRPKSEYDEGHIPGAINLPIDNIYLDAEKTLPDKNQLLLIYCRTGNRSETAAQKFKDLGYTNIIEFGGMLEWEGTLEK